MSLDDLIRQLVADEVARQHAPLAAKVAKLVAQAEAQPDQSRLTVSEAARRYRVREDAIRAAITNETLEATTNPAARGRAPKWLIAPSALDAWVARGRPVLP